MECEGTERLPFHISLYDKHRCQVTLHEQSKEANVGMDLHIISGEMSQGMVGI
jgi:hypothetical protein